MSNIDNYIFGDEQYKTILSILRTSLCNCFNIQYGGLAFYRFVPDKYATQVKIFPINPDIIDLHFPKDNIIKEKYLQAINTVRDYDKLYHLQSFRSNFQTIEHFDFKITDKDKLLEHNPICGINKQSWSDFFTKNDDINILDQLFYESNESKFRAVPLPVLCSPAILMVVPQSILTFQQIDNITQTVSESIHLYLINKLITEVRKDLKPGLINTKKDLVKRFLHELSQVIIPIKYEYDNQEFKCFDWYDNWDTTLSPTFDLNLSEEIVKLYMPTFKWHNDEWLHELPNFKLKTIQTVESIQNIFVLIYDYWQTFNSKKLLIQNEIAPLINDLKMSAAYSKEMKLLFEDKLTEQIQKVEELSKLVIELGGDITQPLENEFYCKIKVDGSKIWKIRYKGIDIIESGSDKGYEGLHVIMANKNNIIDVSALGADGGYYQQDILEDDIKNTLNIYKEKVKEIERKIERKKISIDVGIAEEYAEFLAGYIYCCKEMKYSYSSELNKLTILKKQLESWMSKSEFQSIEKKLNTIAKQAIPNSLNKSQQNGILNPIRQLINRLREEQGCILAPLLDKSVLKIGVKSCFSPKGELDVFWKFTEIGEFIE